MKKILLFLTLIAVSSTCGTDNKTADRSDKTPDEQIRIALDNNDLVTARTLLEQQIEAEPDVYARYPVLGAVYANLAGFDIFKAAANPSSLGSGNLLDSVGSFMPTDPTKDNVEMLGKAVAIIQQIPSDKRTTTSQEGYSTSAAFQEAIYQSAYSIMYMKIFIQTDPTTNKLDVDKLRTMSVDDAAAILKSLRGSAASMAAISGNADTAKKIDEALVEIDAQPGATDNEKLANYIAVKKGAE